MTIKYRYLEESNLYRGTISGVPLADLTADQFSGYPPHVKKAIIASPMYQEQKVSTTKKAIIPPTKKAVPKQKKEN